MMWVTHSFFQKDGIVQTVESKKESQQIEINLFPTHVRNGYRKFCDHIDLFLALR